MQLHAAIDTGASLSCQVETWRGDAKSVCAGCPHRDRGYHDNYLVYKRFIDPHPLSERSLWSLRSRNREWNGGETAAIRSRFLRTVGNTGRQMWPFALRSRVAAGPC